MADIELGEVVAEREFEIQDYSGSEREVVLRIGKPIVDPRMGGDFGCPYQISGLGEEKISIAYGADSLQAFMLAIQKVKADLEYYRNAQGLKLTWLGMEDLNLNF